MKSETGDAPENKAMLQLLQSLLYAQDEIKMFVHINLKPLEGPSHCVLIRFNEEIFDRLINSQTNGLLQP